MDAAIISRIAQDTSIPESSVSAVVALFERGATGPFIVHYRKEATGGLNEARVRSIQERMVYYREVLDQRAALLKSLSDQGKLTDVIRRTIEGCFSKAELEDLHHHFRPRKKTRAAEALEKGLEPLAEYFCNQENDAWSVDEHIAVFIDPAKGISTKEQALQGVVDILAERISANFEYRKALREMLWKEGFLVSSVVPSKVGQKTKYNMYYERREPVMTVPSHRVLAIRRGCKEGVLISSIEGDQSKALDYLLSSVIKDKESVFAPVLEAAVRESYYRLLRPLIETEVRTQLKERADREAIRVFQENLANLLLSPPAGPIVVMGVDWGKGDECSVAVVNENGQFLEGAKVCFTPSSKDQQAKTSKSSPAQAQNLIPAESPSPAEQPIESSKASTPAFTATGEPAPSDAASIEIQLTPQAVAESSPDGTPVPDAIQVSSADVPAAAGVPGAHELENAPPVQSIVAGAAQATEEIQTGSASAVLDETPSLKPLAVPQPSDEHSAPLKKPVDSELEDARRILLDLIAKHNVQAISIGTGARTRELEAVLRQIVAESGRKDLLIAAVNDAGIAIYCSSRIAREEFPDWSASARCAVSLARRLQDPLAELVKIDPKLIGVGQYQHDVDQKELHRGLLQTVQYCVNRVGVNVNTASEFLLRHVSGLNERLARRIVSYRNAHGPFQSRAALSAVVGMDRLTYEQSAAFLRIPNGENPLDCTAVHPESYPIVEKMAAAAGISVKELLGNKEAITSLKLEDFVTDTAGMATLHDIREELLKPGRDPRKTFKVPRFRPDVREMSDLKPGMTLEGTVTNVTNFGAFVDIGVRQDGLVHLSQMSSRFIRDPRDAVKVGDVVKVKVISVEPETKRIGLSMKALAAARQRRRKKQQRNARLPEPARQSNGAPAEASSGAESAPPSSPAEKPAATAIHSRPDRPRENPPRFHKGRRHKPERQHEVQHAGDTASKGQEPSLHEKIAILQSKFKGIN